jgi:hypothetical protein
MPKTVLSVGSNLSLLKIRNAVFVNAGYRVLTARTCTQALNLLRSEQMDAVVVGHSLSRPLQERVVGQAKHDRLAVIVLHANAYERSVPTADANLCGIDGAATIIDVLRELLSEKVSENA